MVTGPELMSELEMMIGLGLGMAPGPGLDPGHEQETAVRPELLAARGLGL